MLQLNEIWLISVLRPALCTELSLDQARMDFSFASDLDSALVRTPYNKVH